MIEIKEKDQCCGCEACKNICPKQCITMVEDEEGFRYPHIDKEKCINCGLCERVCQYKNKVTEVKKDIEAEVYSCVIKDKEKLKNSSTCAVFYYLAKSIIDNKGVVYGAKYDENMNVIHSRVEDLKELGKLRGSKYVQSKIGDMYQAVKKDLEDNRKVLFSGTPCQVGGLYKFLGQDDKNLLTVDIICFGVPSPKIFRDYIKITEKKYNSKIIDINFRDKTRGWQNSSTRIKFADDTIKYLKPSNDNKWYRTFISHIITRESCNNCLYTSTDRKADITIGDFWGIENIDKDLDITSGVSKVIVNTEKGKEIFSTILPLYEVKKRKLEDAIRPNLIRPPKKNKNRDDFYKLYNEQGFIKSYNKFVKEKILNKFKRKIKSKIKHIIKLK